MKLYLCYFLALITTVLYLAITSMLALKGIHFDIESLLVVGNCFDEGFKNKCVC